MGSGKLQKPLWYSKDTNAQTPFVKKLKVSRKSEIYLELLLSSCVGNAICVVYIQNVNSQLLFSAFLRITRLLYQHRARSKINQFFSKFGKNCIA
jgi:hypothetical protein